MYSVKLMQVTSSLHIMGKPHIEHSGVMQISNLQSSLLAKIKFEASSRLSWGESHQVYILLLSTCLHEPPCPFLLFSLTKLASHGNLSACTGLACLTAMTVYHATLVVSHLSQAVVQSLQLHSLSQQLLPGDRTYHLVTACFTSRKHVLPCDSMFYVVTACITL